MAYELDIYKNGEKIETLKQIEAPWSLVKYCIKLWKNKDKELLEKYQNNEDVLIEELVTGLFKTQLNGRDINSIDVSGKQILNVVNQLMNEVLNGFHSANTDEKN